MIKDLVISTAVIVGECQCYFDIDAIYTYLEITDKVLKLKCNNKEKSKTKEISCRTFYNQISISLSNKANVKLFNNGKFQLSGVKTIEQAKENLQYIFGLIKNMSGTIKIKPVMYKGLAVYKNKIVIKKQGVYVCDNVIKNENIIIDGEICDVFEYCDNTYLQRTHCDKKKKLYNSNCEEVGMVEYEMTRKNKNLCLKGSTFSKKGEGEYLITNKYKSDTGVMKIHIYDDTISENVPEEIDLEYRACSINPEIVDIRIVNVNSNTKIVLNKNEFLDRDMICEYLSKNDINYIYDPCRYAGIKFSYGDTKITMFRTGSILFSSKEPDTRYFDYIRKIFSENDFVRSKNKDKNEEPEKKLTIWDL